MYSSYPLSGQGYCRPIIYKKISFSSLAYHRKPLHPQHVLHRSIFPPITYRCISRYPEALFPPYDRYWGSSRSLEREGIQEDNLTVNKICTINKMKHKIPILARLEKLFQQTSIPKRKKNKNTQKNTKKQNLCCVLFLSFKG